MYKVLVIDDDEIDRTQLKRMLVNQNDISMDVADVTTGKQAIDYALKNKPHCILLDYNLTDYKGDEFIKQFRETHQLQDIPIIILTGQSDEATAIKSLKLGVKDYLVKDNLCSENLIRVTNNCIENYIQQCKESDLKEQLTFDAKHDYLTGLSNKQQFEQEVNRILSYSKRHASYFSIMYIDLDGFKKVNDTHGHDVGDKLLQEVSTRLKKMIRLEDVAARLGGDEFAVLLYDLADMDLLGKKANKIIDALSQNYQINNTLLKINASIGIATYPDSGQDYQTLLKSADVAMYNAKHTGKGKHVFYDKSLCERHLENQKLCLAVYKAFKANEFYLHYQPSIDLSNERVIGIEALLRWDHPKYQYLNTAKLLHVIKDLGFIQEVDEWVCQHALSAYQTLEQSVREKIKLSINVDQTVLSNEKFIENLDQIVKRNHVSPEQIMLDISECTFTKEGATVLSNMNQLKEIGYDIAVDNFGLQGLSVIDLLSMPVNTLKIDKVYVDVLLNKDPKGRALKSMLALASNFSLNLIVKGVETQSQAAFLQQCHCPYAQGYFYQPATTLKSLF